MRLLSPKEKKEMSSLEKGERTEQVVALENTVHSLNKEVNRLRDLGKSENERIRKEHEGILKAYEDERVRAEEDTKKILAIKAVALEPLDMIKKGLDAREASISERESSITDRETRVTASLNAAKALNDGIEERTKDCEGIEKSVSKREKEMDAREIHYRNFVKSKEIALNKERDRIRKLMEKVSEQ